MSDDPRLINLRNNAAKFLKNDPQELALIDSLFAQDVNLQIFAEKAGWHNLIIDHDSTQVRYHREKDPFGEFAEQLKQKEPPQILVCLGTGFGYQWLRAAQHLEGIKDIIIVDPIFESLFLFLTEQDLSNILPDRTSILFTPERQVLSKYLWTRLNRYHLSNIQFIQLSSMKTLAPGFLNNVAEEIEEGWARHEVFIHSMEDQFDEITTNVKANMTGETIANTLQEECGKGERCLIVGSGPSVDNIATVLPHIAKHVHIIAGGSAARIIKKNGVDPDLTIISDPQMINRMHFLQKHSEPVAFDPVIDSRILSGFHGKYLVIHTGHALIDVFFNILGVPFLDCWGTVTSAALSLAQNAGFDEIAMIGMEFSFSGSEQHATHYAAKGAQGKTEPVRDTRNRLTNTNKAMRSYADYVSNQVSEVEKAGINIINLMEGGILDAGTTWTARQYLASMDPTVSRKKHLNWTRKLAGLASAKEKISAFIEKEWTAEIAFLEQCDGQEITLTDVFRKMLLAALEGGCLTEGRKLEASMISGGDPEMLEKNKQKLLSKLNSLRDEILTPICEQL